MAGGLATVGGGDESCGSKLGAGCCATPSHRPRLTSHPDGDGSGDFDPMVGRGESRNNGRDGSDESGGRKGRRS